MEDQIERYLREELFVDRKARIGLDESLISSGLLDSLTLLQLISFLEDSFGVSVDSTEMHPDNFQTIQAMTVFIQRKRS